MSNVNFTFWVIQWNEIYIIFIKPSFVHIKLCQDAKIEFVLKYVAQMFLQIKQYMSAFIVIYFKIQFQILHKRLTSVMAHDNKLRVRSHISHDSTIWVGHIFQVF